MLNTEQALKELVNLIVDVTEQLVILDDRLTAAVMLCADKGTFKLDEFEKTAEEVRVTRDKWQAVDEMASGKVH